MSIYNYMYVTDPKIKYDGKDIELTEESSDFYCDLEIGGRGCREYVSVP